MDSETKSLVCTTEHVDPVHEAKILSMIHEDDEMYKEGKRLVKIYRKDLD